MATFNSLTPGRITGSGSIRNGFYGGSRYVYESAAIIAEERERTQRRVDSFRAVHGLRPVQCEFAPRVSPLARQLATLLGD